MERELVRLEQLADDVRKMSVAVPQRHEVEAEVHGLREARAAGARRRAAAGQLELHMVTEPAARAHLQAAHQRRVAGRRALAPRRRRARARAHRRARVRPAELRAAGGVGRGGEEAARLAAEAKVDYVDEAEAAAAPSSAAERHCLVDVGTGPPSTRGCAA